MALDADIRPRNAHVLQSGSVDQKRLIPLPREALPSLAFLGTSCCVLLLILLLLLLIHAFPAKRQGASCRQAAVEGCHNPTPCWTRQIQARPNLSWARCSVVISPPASQGHPCCVWCEKNALPEVDWLSRGIRDISCCSSHLKPASSSC